MNVAILGATGQIAQCVLFILSKERKLHFHLFARGKEKLDLIKQGYPDISAVCHYGYDDFQNYNYDIIVNGISVGTHEKYKSDFRLAWMLTERYDNMIISRLEACPSAKYINFSSGAAYGGDFASPADDNTLLSMDINHFRKENAYAMAKAASECKHRSFEGLNIIDLRIFGFFSRFINLDYSFLLCDILHSVQNKETMLTSPADITRDYIHLSDFRNLLLSVIEQERINDVLDVRSKSPARKFEILDFFKNNYGLRYSIDANQSFTSVTGLKPNYYSTRSTELYTPEHTALECISDEIPFLI